MKSGNLNFLEPSGPLQACNGTDLPFTNYLNTLIKMVKNVGEETANYVGRVSSNLT